MSTEQPSSYSTFSTGNSSSYGITGTGTSSVKPTGYPSNSSSAVCTGKTLNVLGASLDWWYTRTLYNVVATISLQQNSDDVQTGWTIVPATTPFDIASALASPTCSSTLTYNTDYNQSLYDVKCTPAPTPVAAGTTVITQTAYQPLSASTGTGPIPDVIETPPPASISIPSSGGTYGEGTAFVFFSSYEIMTKSQTKDASGGVGCAQVTNTYPMATPFSFEYADGDVNGSKVVGAGVTGDVNPAFLQVVGLSNAAAGSWVAAPTVALVVQDIYAAEAVLAAKQGPLLTTETSLMTPEPTLPSGFTPPPGGSTENHLPTIGFTGHVESSAQSLALPTVPHTDKPGGGPQTNGPTPPGGQHTGNGGGTPTNAGGSPTNGGGRPTNGGGSPTKGPGSPPNGGGRPTNGGGSPTNPGEQPTNPGGQPTNVNGGRPTAGHGGGIASLVSAIISAVKPTNAVQVLQQAEQTFTNNNNPTVAAIVHGISGPNPTHDGGASPGGGSPSTGGQNSPAENNGGIAPDQNNVVGPGPNGTPVVVVGGTTFTANSETQFNLGPAATLTPGGKVVVSGTTVSLASGLTAVVVDGVTHPAATPAITPAPALTIGGTTYIPNGGSTYNIAGQPLTPGGIITVHGTTISLGPGASSIVVNGLTQNLAPASSATITAAPTLTIGGQTFTAINSGGTYVINGETLTPGESETVTIHGKTYIVSLAPGATVLVIETVGSGGDVTATTFETLYPGHGSEATVTHTVGVGATAGSKPTSGPTHTVKASLQNGAASFLSQMRTVICFSLGTLALAIWL